MQSPVERREDTVCRKEEAPAESEPLPLPDRVCTPIITLSCFTALDQPEMRLCLLVPMPVEMFGQRSRKSLAFEMKETIITGSWKMVKKRHLCTFSLELTP
eukprot:gb/GECG01007979.1/.p1 GENE.gb/GECG01007979.1/~~gb/GECG01007979.1/.p1  ORF type:complete len:101 (+),score=10.73 gb/GECG01007979.1/:1-303(+)